MKVIEDPDNKYFSPFYAKKNFELLFEVLISSKLLKTFEDAEEKCNYTFIKPQKQHLLGPMLNYFTVQKSFTKRNCKVMLLNISKGSAREDEAHRDNLSTHISKLNRKCQKK